MGCVCNAYLELRLAVFGRREGGGITKPRPSLRHSLWFRPLDLERLRQLSIFKIPDRRRSSLSNSVRKGTNHRRLCRRRGVCRNRRCVKWSDQCLRRETVRAAAEEITDRDRASHALGCVATRQISAALLVALWQI